MPYNRFTLREARSTFNLTLEETTPLFPQVQPVPPSEVLRLTLQDHLPLATAINTEKSRSELLIAPVLSEVRRQMHYQISLFSGTEFEVDPAQDLTGYPDFLLSRSPEQYFITAPVVTIVEAKNENIVGGLGQCVAEMVAAQRFNADAQLDIPAIYGCVTTGVLWKFLKLTEQTVTIDPSETPLMPVDHLLGIFVQILN